MNAFERQIIDNVKTHGFQANFVFDPEGHLPDFTYSIGFPETLGCGDFIIFGLGQTVMHNLLWEIFRQIKGGKTPHDGAQWPDLLEGDYVCISKRVKPEYHIADYANSAMWYVREVMSSSKPFELYQMVWPSVSDALYPWDPDCPLDVMEAQPKLY